MKNLTITLPCNVGDTVYIFEDKTKKEAATALKKEEENA